MDNTTPKNSSGIFFPVDLLMVGIAGLWFLALGEGLIGTGFRLQVVGIAILITAPGYALIAALFPEKSHAVDNPEQATGQQTRIFDSPSIFERLLLAVGCSVSLIPLVGLGLEFFTNTISMGTIISMIGGITLLFTFVAVVRRLLVPRDVRYSLHIRHRTSALGELIMNFRSLAAIDVLLVIGFVVAAGGLGTALLTADHGENFTEFELTTVDPDNGTHVADGYPSQMQSGDDEEVWVGITNNEGQSMEYTVVMELQSVGPDGEIEERESLDRISVSLEEDETWRDAQTISPTITGDDIRVVFLLYAGDPPADGTTNMDDAYRHAHFWLTVSEYTASRPAPSDRAWSS